MILSRPNGSIAKSVPSVEPGAKAILPEPRSVKQQFPISHALKTMRLPALLTLAALLGRPSSFAAAYYLDPASGSLSNPGTVSEPWPSLEAVAAAGKIFVAGDELILRPGFHGSPTIRGQNSGLQSWSFGVGD